VHSISKVSRSRSRSCRHSIQIQIPIAIPVPIKSRQGKKESKTPGPFAAHIASSTQKKRKEQTKPNTYPCSIYLNQGPDETGNPSLRKRKIYIREQNAAQYSKSTKVSGSTNHERKMRKCMAKKGRKEDANRKHHLNQGKYLHPEYFPNPHQPKPNFPSKD